MKNRYTGKFGYARKPGCGLKFVNNDGINYIRRNSDRISDLTGQDSAEVGCVLSAHTYFKILEQLISNGICAAGNGFEHAAAAYYHIETL